MDQPNSQTIALAGMYAIASFAQVSSIGLSFTAHKGTYRASSCRAHGRASSQALRLPNPAVNRSLPEVKRNLASSFPFRAAASAASLAIALPGLRRACRRTGNMKGRSFSSRAAQVNADARGGAEDVGVVLLSAGVGKRMGANIPKQYLKLLGLEIALHSLNVFLECNVKEIVIVCAEDWQSVFEDHLKKKKKVDCVVKYTSGGKERQDSVSNGLAKISSEFVAVHDAARPLVTPAEVHKVIAEARQYGAALLAVQTKATIKQAKAGANGEPMVAATPARKALWEAHTPQVIKADLLRQGFKNAVEKNLEVTDDVSLIESLGLPVKLTEGEYTNLKVTTPEDIAVAETILRQRGFNLSSE